MDDVTEPIVEEFNGWLAGLFKSEGSDLHVKVGSPPMYRMPDGLLRLDRAPLTFAGDERDRRRHRPGQHAATSWSSTARRTSPTR